MDAANEPGPCGERHGEHHHAHRHVPHNSPRTAVANGERRRHRWSHLAPPSPTAKGVVTDGNRKKRTEHQRRRPRRSNLKLVAASASLLSIVALSSRTVLLTIQLAVDPSNRNTDGVGEREETYDPLAGPPVSGYGHNLRGASSMATTVDDSHDGGGGGGGGGGEGGRPSAAAGRMRDWDHVFLPTVPAPGGWPIEGHELRRGDGNLTLSTVVPSLVGDGRNGNLARLVLSMRSQTVPADEVVIVTSDINGDGGRLRPFPDGGAGLCGDLHRKLRTVLGSRPPLRLVCVGERLTAGRARNVAARLSGGQVLSFVDADDRELPPRNEVTKNLLACYPELKMVLHSYTSSDPSKHEYDVSKRGRNDTTPVPGGGGECADREEGLEVVRGAALYDILRKTYKRWWIRGDLAHGHVVVRREVWDDEVRFTSLAKGEDSAFIRDVLFTYGRDDGASVFINRPLTSYDKSNKANKDILK